MSEALLINYEYCSGCHTCEIACQQVHGLAPDQFGIEVKQIGPDQISTYHWQYEFFPVPTERCDHCAARVAAGEKPSCVKHCQAGCIDYGSVIELAAKITGPKFVLFS
jgi:anaerobic dimethyl sulfoxide reductase subunit B (iron-sulfur subunit)